MAWQYTPYTVVLVLATLVGVATTALTWRRRSDSAARWASYTNASITLWAGFHLLTLSSTIYEVKIAAYTLALTSIPCLVVTAFGYVVHFTGRGSWLTRRRLAALSAVPVVSLLGLLTNPWHQRIVTDIFLDHGGAFVKLTYTPGVLWYVYGAVYYAFVCVTLALLLRRLLHVRNVYRKITFVVFVVLLLPSVGAAFSFLQESPWPHFLILPHVFLLTSVLGVLAMTSVRFVRSIPIDRLLTGLDPRADSVVPLARDFVVEEVDSGIVVLDAENRIVDINSTGKLMIGADRPLGRPIGEAAQLDLVDDEELRAAMADGDADLTNFEGEVWVTAPDGSRCYDARITPIDAGGTRVGTVVLLHDITWQKRREEKLREREAELERKKSNLETQARKLEHQNERLDEFASLVSHDLRNPLNVAKGYLDLVRAKAADDDEDVEPADLDEALRSTARMETIIEDALTLAREGKAITETAPVDVEAVVEDAWENVATGSATLEVDLTDADGRPLLVEGDRSRLTTVFENLFRNSIEHGRVDDRPITVTVGRLADEPGFFVADDGPGIPVDQRDAILERGFTTNDDGTGLGLSIVQDVVRAHGWDLEVAESESGGARFDVVDVELATDESVSPSDGEESSTELRYRSADAGPDVAPRDE